MKHHVMRSAGVAIAAALTLAACSSDDGSSSTPDDTGSGSGDEPVTLTMSAWSLDSTPEFQLLADEFNAINPNVTVELQEYDAAEYDTQITADLSAGAAPDLYILKNLKYFATFQDGEQLVDVSDVADGVGEGNGALDFYEVDGATWAVPYRQDTWFTYYNKSLFDEAGIAHPEGAITWDEYADLANQLNDGLDATGSYQHSWQSTLQGFALAQTPGADLFSGDFSFLAPYYDRVLAMQESGAQTDFATVQTNQLTYQAQFGTQEAAMMNMGSWYVATLIAQQESGEAEDFEWGFMPAPQYDDSTLETPVSFGDPTAVGINPQIDEAKMDAAKEFLAFVGSEDAASALAQIGIKPAFASDAVTEAYFSVAGLPQDELSQFAFGTHETLPENPVSLDTAAIQNILNDAHSAILTDSVSVEDGIAEAQERVANEVG
ncbi:ABC transporter substrate-binding protein [Demequina muriae]|uniref:Extracellular solute-binding protein n=1 Tax=Demequina muriae TaxID=3051664 RepID=A0ABT8GF29_9MICO|nr:extracellular solute-binding protein [Demequina sp. EGI L300058]MDN4479871.1 extracellular solute-binding protein [Demequina sp. EGI L300058]